MRKNVDLNEISDGRKYRSADMVKAGCHDCKDCSSCCQGMGDSILLEPYDIYMLQGNLHVGFEKLLKREAALGMEDGVILPHIRMDDKERCPFLDKNERCSIHAFRPGLCRLFPLGRVYEEDGFYYILQVHECPKPNKTKVKIQKWMGVPSFGEYETYVLKWHNLIKYLQEDAKEIGEEVLRTRNLYFLNLFYVYPFHTGEDFYPQFYARMKEFISKTGISFPV